MVTGDDGRGASEQRGPATVLAGEPRLAYQPVIDLLSGRVLGFEALLRWHHPTRGVVLPQLLIPWAEANGDIVALGEWVLVEGCRRATEWPPSVQLAVNCSIVQLRRGMASAAVRRALDESGLSPDRLTVEVTEHALSEEAATADLRAIAGLGVQLAVDDVGTSWNSFELLRRLDVNTIKIDGSFVSALEAREGINRMVVQTVIHLAHTCGMSTVAEGVETAGHSAIVREFESDAAQGYFFAPPLDGELATRLANLPDLSFPLEGPGWTDGDDWPFPGAEAEQSTPPPRRARHARRGNDPELDGPAVDGNGRVPDLDNPDGLAELDAAHVGAAAPGPPPDGNGIAAGEDRPAEEGVAGEDRPAGEGVAGEEAVGQDQVDGAEPTEPTGGRARSGGSGRPVGAPRPRRRRGTGRS